MPDPIGPGISGTGTGSGGAVSSVSNTDGTLTVSPTTGAVVASLGPTYQTESAYWQSLNFQ